VETGVQSRPSADATHTHVVVSVPNVLRGSTTAPLVRLISATRKPKDEKPVGIQAKAAGVSTRPVNTIGPTMVPARNAGRSMGIASTPVLSVSATSATATGGDVHEGTGEPEPARPRVARIAPTSITASADARKTKAAPCDRFSASFGLARSRASRASIGSVGPALGRPSTDLRMRSSQFPGTPFSSRVPRVENPSPDPATICAIVEVTRTCPGPAVAETLAAVVTAIPATFRPAGSTSPI
jgi:hypothetical protein